MIANWIWLPAFTVETTVGLVNEALLNTFRNDMLNKKVKFDCHRPLRITDIIKKYLKKAYKLKKCYYKWSAKK